jgi:small subunit ribosomal protein S4
MERQNRNRPPGMHFWRRSKGTTYGIRLREKQKVKRYYGLYERQFARYFQMAERARGNTGEALLQLLERRLDNVVRKLGFAPSPKAARELITHGHITINGKKVDRPSFLVKVGEKVSVSKREKSQKLVKLNLETFGEGASQGWLQLTPESMEGAITALPSRDDVQIPVEEQLIVEMCSR